jgi:predicted GTPase
MALNEAYEERIRPLLDIVDKLRKIGVEHEGIKLPTIVVVGDQSSGKSSVIERLSGVTLPRGVGIVTRVPLVMRLQKKKESSVTIEYGISRKDIKHEEVEAAVKTATESLAGEEKGVCNKPITLTVCREDLPDLTLVDLPGITRVPVKGQPQDIYRQVVDMIMTQIKPEETVILNVISAVVDWATCESFSLSKEVDPKGTRTLAVVTNADREPEGLYEKVGLRYQSSVSQLGKTQTIVLSSSWKDSQFLRNLHADADSGVEVH